MPRRVPVSLVFSIVLAATLALHGRAPAEPVLDYEFYQSRVEPIFLKKRPNLARCYTCHVDGNNAFRLEKLTPGASAWTEEQSRRNFETVSLLVNAGDPASSRLLQQPLAPEAGGNVFHSGGRQFASTQDPDWQTIAQWISGAKPAARQRK
jgi:hypothetical protein